jgi:hypothetical protein
MDEINTYGDSMYWRGHHIKRIGWLEGGTRWVVQEHGAHLETPHMVGRPYLSMGFAVEEAERCQGPVAPRPISEDARRLIADQVQRIEAERMAVAR